MIYEMLEKRSPSQLFIVSFNFSLLISNIRERLVIRVAKKPAHSSHKSSNQNFFLSFTRTRSKSVGQVEKGGNGTAGRCDKGHELQLLNSRLWMGTRGRSSSVVSSEALPVCRARGMGAWRCSLGGSNSKMSSANAQRGGIAR